jgi:hypothetical protein
VSHRIERSELTAEFFGRLSFKTGAENGVIAREIGESVSEGAQVKAGAADHDREMPTPPNLGQSRLREMEKLGDIEGLGERNFAHEMMGHAGAQLGRRFGGEHVEPLVNLEGIRADDFSAAAFRDGDGEFAFPYSGGAGDDEEASG